jgi:outer membrane protein OmpA-like peptidoglycan-associated protein
MPPTQYSESIRKNGPLKGLPETPEEGDRTDFSGIYFRVNSDDFDLSRPETMNNLGKMLDYMKQCDQIGVVIEGHTSSEGNPRWNQQLSERRSERVRNWLIDNGVAPEKILSAVGYGSQIPKIPEPQPGTVPNSLLEQIRRQNRRITTLVEKPCK